jgi:RNA polymerase sigma factor (sigma-70 family)
MRAANDPGTLGSDESLLASARAGDSEAFAELWRRHATSGLRVARGFTSVSDADDLVAEAYVRIFQRVRDGGGPTDAFRPYLYTTIRNLARRWGRARCEVNVEELASLEDPEIPDDPAVAALDRGLTVQAFRALPERWQSVLWYTEVEGMDPHEVAPILGITANGVAALSYRAREGLRKAWLQAHVSDEGASGECRWTINRLGEHARGGLTARERSRVADHLTDCAKCCSVSEEMDEAGSRLALILIPLIAGSGGGGILASFATPSSATAAGLGATALTGSAVGSLAAAVVLSVGLAVGTSLPPMTTATPDAASHSLQSNEASATAPLDATPPGSSKPGTLPTTPLPGAASTPGSGTQADATAAVSTPEGGATVGLSVPPLSLPLPTAAPAVPGLPEQSVTQVVTVPGSASATATLDLSGTGAPAATVSLRSDAAVYATSTVSSNGTWSIHVESIPTAGGLQLVQGATTSLGLTVAVPLVVLSNSLGLPLRLVQQ